MIKRQVISARLIIAIVTLAVLLNSGTPLFAWNAGGHMIVASIAYARLNDTARTEVDRLLAIKIKPVEKTEQSLDFVNAAHWADDVKRSKGFESTAEEHYIDNPFTTDGTALPTDLPNANNIVAALKKYVEILKTSSDDQEKAQALRFVIHFVGDIHQPLHCATRVTSDRPEGDQGGNKFQITVISDKGRKKKGELHALWDDGIETFPLGGPHYAPPDLSEIPAARKKVVAGNPATNRAWKKGGPFAYEQWASESEHLAETVVYKNITEGETPSAAYDRAAVRVSRRRVAWAGYRLAALLNAIWTDKAE